MSRPEFDTYDAALVDAIDEFETTLYGLLGGGPIAELTQSSRDADWDLKSIFSASVDGLVTMEIRHIDLGEGGWTFTGKFRAWRDVHGLRVERLTLRDDGAWSIHCVDPSFEVYFEDEQRAFAFMIVALGRREQ